jgi:hypothetical protein
MFSLAIVRLSSIGDLLLSVLALVVLGVAGRIVLLRVTGSLGIAGLCSPLLCPTIPSRSFAVSYVGLGWAITTLLRLWLISSRSLPHLRSTPWRNIGSAPGDIVPGARACPPRLHISRRSSVGLTEFCHETRVLRVEAFLDHRLRRTTHRNSIGILVNRTVTRHVTCTSTDTTDDVSSEVFRLGAIIFAMANPATVLAYLVFVVAEGAVESGQFTKLIPLVVILAFGSGSSLNMTR